MTKEEFKAWRGRMKLSKTEVAKMFSVHPATVTRWEDGSTALPGMAGFAAAAVANGWPPEPRTKEGRRKWVVSM